MRKIGTLFLAVVITIGISKFAFTPDVKGEVIANNESVQSDYLYEETALPKEISIGTEEEKEEVVEEETKEETTVAEEKAVVALMAAPEPEVVEPPKEEKPKDTTSSNTKKATSGDKAKYQAYAYDLVINQYHWSEADFDALVNLWERESNWNPNATNKSSGAHGIPQSLPASKMASYGDDYMTNYETQIQWGLNYIKNRYGTPTKAWQHSCKKGWY